MAVAKFLDPKNDYAFKRIFGTEKNKAILVHFLIADRHIKRRTRGAQRNAKIKMTIDNL